MTIDIFIGNLATAIINPLITLMFALAVVYFLWGVFQYIKNADSDEGRQKGGRSILYGLLGIVIMIGVYGIIQIFTSMLFVAS